MTTLNRTIEAIRRIVSKALLCTLVWGSSMLTGSLKAQTSADSIQIARSIEESHSHLVKHNYAEAIAVAQRGLDKSARLNYKWGIVSNLLILAQAQKSQQHYPASLNSYLQALSEVEKQNDKVTLAWINMKIGELFQEWGVPEKALPYYNTALQHQTKENTDLIERLAETHLSLGQNDLTLAMYLRLLDVLRKQKRAEQTMYVLDRIAFICHQSNDMAGSLKYNLDLLEVARQVKDSTRIASSLNTIGSHYKDMRNPDKALAYYQESLAMNRLINKKGANDNSVITNLINIGAVYQSRSDVRNAIRSFNEALELKKQRGTPVEVAIMHNYLASLYLSMGNYADAEGHTQTAINILSGTDNRRVLATNYKRLSEIYATQGNYERSLKSYQQYSVLKDSLLYQEQLLQETERLKALAIEASEKEAKLSLIDYEMKALSLRNEKEKAERERQQITFLLKEKELQNLSLQKEQLEQAREVQQLQLRQGEIEKQKQEQAILLLEQNQELQQAEIERSKLVDSERDKEIAFQNTRLELQQVQLERGGIRQQFLIYTAVLLLVIVVLVLIGYSMKRRDNNKLQEQYNEINNQKQQIESINKKLVELNEEKNDLIGIVAHDLKSPLNQISGMLEIMKLTTREQPEQHGYTLKIEESAKRLKNMVTKILDVNAIESQTLNIKQEQIDTTALLDEIVNRFNEMAANKQIAIVKQFENNTPSIVSDVGYLSEVLENLMSNAVKYSPLQKQVTVRLSKRVDSVRFEFIDQGQGINEKDMKNLFGKYRKLSARPTAGEDSTGLGLSIVKKYVLALNGRVWCESEEGKGSNFIVEMPVRSDP